MPQFKKADIKATVGQRMLEVTAAHHETSEENGKQYLHHETSSQYFRRVSLPPGADTSNLHASFRHGVLRITMPFQHDKKGTDIAIE
jgi:HSP20 family protein